MKYLRVCLVGASPETMRAFEYESATYLSQVKVPELPSTSWQSDPLQAKELIGQLRHRGWHTTDIGDAMDEARTNVREA